MKTKLTLIAFQCLLFFSCSNDTLINNNVQNDFGKPIWPQYGFNARHTGNINSLNTYIKPVELGIEHWTYTFPSFRGDGSEITVDSKGNIYFLNQSLLNQAKLCKFSPNGEIIWSFDTLQSDNYFGMALSCDEKNLYFTAFRNDSDKGLYCLDSSGNIKWKNDIGSASSRPIIDKNEKIYCLTGFGLYCLDRMGNIIYHNARLSLWPRYGELAIDKSGNIYTCGTKVEKIDPDGNIVWSFSPNSNFYTQGVVIDANNNIYFTTHFNAHPYTLYSLNKDGVLRWQRDTNYTFIPAITNENQIFCGGNGLTLLDTNGNIIWYKGTHNGTSYRLSESPVIDGENNVYYIVDGETRLAGSYDKNGNFRWSFNANYSTATLPGPTLSPLGYLLLGPKRSYSITSVK